MEPRLGLGWGTPPKEQHPWAKALSRELSSRGLGIPFFPSLAMRLLPPQPQRQRIGRTAQHLGR